MNLFPLVDPIPLPAPVWLFKALHLLTTALHFTAMQMMLGGILVAVCLNLGRRAPNDPRTNAALSIARRLPVVMTYVINLGVPPLLFAQVLYGRALYTSSVLIGAYWISVIFLLILCYWLLYKFAERVQAGKAGWPFGLASWLLAGAIAKIYVTNMTLMIRPNVWNEMYNKSASGIILPTGDPTMLPRWCFMLAGGLVAAGLWMLWLAGRKHIDPAVRGYLARWGGLIAMVMVVAQAGIAFWVLKSQPEAVRTGLATNSFYHISGLAWLGMGALALLICGWSAVAKPATTLLGWVAALVGFLGIACMTVYRDGIRDLTLGMFNYNYSDRVVVTNWGVVGIFLGLFVIGLVIAGWLISVMVRAKPISEKVTI
jgi:hypothetical protein